MTGAPGQPPAGPAPARRVLVLGCPGTGKSTFAGTLAGRTGLPLRRLDDEYWGPGWSRPAPEAWLDRLAELTAAPDWIIDGNYLPSLDIRLARAQLVVMLDAPVATCLTRVLRRAGAIRAGRLDGLPAQVRARAAGGARVPATRDFPALVRMILRFRRVDWWQVVRRVGDSAAGDLILAVQPGWLGPRTGSVRRRLRRAGVPAIVCPVAVAAELVRARVAGAPADPGPPARATVPDPCPRRVTP